MRGPRMAEWLQLRARCSDKAASTFHSLSTTVAFHSHRSSRFFLKWNRPDSSAGMHLHFHCCRLAFRRRWRCHDHDMSRFSTIKHKKCMPSRRGPWVSSGSSGAEWWHSPVCRWVALPRISGRPCWVTQVVLDFRHWEQARSKNPNPQRQRPWQT